MYKQEDDVVRMKVFKREYKKREFKGKVKEYWDNTWTWVDDNKEFLITVVIPSLIGAGVGVYKLTKPAREQNNKLKETYDPRTGNWYRLRRPLTNKEMIELDRRFRAGESKGDILESFRILK